MRQLEKSVQSEKQRGLGWNLGNPNISDVGRGRDGREEAVRGRGGPGHQNLLEISRRKE